MIWSVLIALVSFAAVLAIIFRNRHLAEGAEMPSVSNFPADSIEEKVSALSFQAAQVASVGFLVLLKNFFGYLSRTLSLFEKKLHQLVNRLVGRDKESGQRGSASFFLRHIAEHKKTLDRNGL